MCFRYCYVGSGDGFLEVFKRKEYGNLLERIKTDHPLGVDSVQLLRQGVLLTGSNEDDQLRLRIALIFNISDLQNLRFTISLLYKFNFRFVLFFINRYFTSVFFYIFFRITHLGPNKNVGNIGLHVGGVQQLSITCDEEYLISVGWLESTVKFWCLPKILDKVNWVFCWQHIISCRILLIMYTFR